MFKHRNRNQNRSVEILNVDLETIGIEEAALKSKIIDATKQQIYDLAAGVAKKTSSVGRNWNHNTAIVEPKPKQRHHKLPVASITFHNQNMRKQPKSNSKSAAMFLIENSDTELEQEEEGESLPQIPTKPKYFKYGS